MLTTHEAGPHGGELHERDQEDAVREATVRYQSEAYARQYQREYQGGLALKNVRSRIIAQREVSVLRSLLQRIETDGRVLLDLPCGTGKLGLSLIHI